MSRQWLSYEQIGDMQNTGEIYIIASQVVEPGNEFINTINFKNSSAIFKTKLKGYCKL